MTHIYHGTIVQNLQVLEPHKRYTPGGEVAGESIPARVYASYNKAYAVAHSFPWSSDEGIDIQVHDEVVELLIPRGKEKVLDQEICIYALPDDTFVHTKEEATGLTYHSEVAVPVRDCECFLNVREAMEKCGGKVMVVG